MMNNGNHYHPADGVFVAPISGVYMFSWNTLTVDKDFLFTELRVAKCNLDIFFFIATLHLIIKFKYLQCKQHLVILCQTNVCGGGGVIG
jgi:hypothetical protein